MRIKQQTIMCIKSSRSKDSGVLQCQQVARRLHLKSKVAIEGLDIPTHVIESCKFRGGELDRVQKRGYQATASKTVATSKKNPHCYCCFVAIVHYFAEIVTFCQFAQHPGMQVLVGRNDKVGRPDHDLS